MKKQKLDFSFVEAWKLLKPIPNEEFIFGCFSDGESGCCVMGHYTRLMSNNPEDYSNYNCRDYTEGENNGEYWTWKNDFRKSCKVFETDIVDVNNYTPDEKRKYALFLALKKLAKQNGERWHKSLNIPEPKNESILCSE
jgi:hypothetical protein